MSHTGSPQMGGSFGGTPIAEVSHETTQAACPTEITRHRALPTVILKTHNPGRDTITLKLSAPKTLTFLIAAALMAFGIIAEFTSILDVSGDTAALALAGGGVLLAIGCLFKGI